MSGCVHSGRWAISIFIVIFLIVLILAGIPSIAVTRSASSRDTVKTWLEESGIYDNAVDTIAGFIGIMMEQDEESIPSDTEEEELYEEGETGNEGIPQNEAQEQLQEELTDPSSETTERLGSIFTPEKIREIANDAIDGLYDWFEGKTSKPRIMIQLADDPEELIDILIFGLDEKLASLPPCDPDVNPQENFNPFEAQCLPEGYGTADMEQFFEENKDSEEFGQLEENAVISTEDMNITPETTEKVQNIYWVVKNTYLIVIGAYVLTVLLLLLLIPDFPAKLHVIGITSLISAGLVLIGSYFSTFLYDYLWQNLEDQIPAEQLGVMESTIGSLTEVAMADILDQVRIWSIGVMIFGVFLVTIGVIVSLLQNRRNRSFEEMSREGMLA
jgi:hypothetical protein